MQILWENSACIVCVKPAGVESEDRPASGSRPPAGPKAVPGNPSGEAGGAALARPNTMPALLRAHWGRADAPVFCVHRLDTATGGVMVYAKTKAAAAFLSQQITGSALQKQYLCVCAGAPEPPCGEMHDFLFKDSRKNKVFTVKSARKGAKQAFLDYEVLESRAGECTGSSSAASEQIEGAAQIPASACLEGTCPPEASASSAQGTRPQRGVPAKSLCGDSAAPTQAAALCRVLLHTGRTHQIRVQFASRKHPLFGDGKYGSRQKGPLGLWCESLTFTPPGEPSPRTFTAPPPDAAPWDAFAPGEPADF